MNVRWDGPSGAVNRDVGAETGAGDVLEQGCVYNVSEELGENLIRYDANWQIVRDGEDEVGELTALTREKLDDVAVVAGIENPKRFQNKRALAVEIVKARSAAAADQQDGGDS